MSEIRLYYSLKCDKSLHFALPDPGISELQGFTKKHNQNRQQDGLKFGTEVSEILTGSAFRRQF